jgi:hypothetical protein
MSNYGTIQAAPEREKERNSLSRIQVSRDGESEASTAIVAWTLSAVELITMLFAKLGAAVVAGIQELDYSVITWQSQTQ